MNLPDVFQQSCQLFERCQLACWYCRQDVEMFCVVVVVVLLSFFSVEVSPACFHEDLDPLDLKRVDTAHPKKRLSALVAQPIRIFADTHELDTDIMNSTVAFRSFVWFFSTSNLGSKLCHQHVGESSG